MLWNKLMVVLTLIPSIIAIPSVHRRKVGDGLSPRHEHSHSHSHLRRAAGSSTYTVVSGDTGNAIAAAYSITFSTLSNSNPSVNWNSLQIGQSLVMPSARTPISYNVVSGDTGTSISNEYDIYFTDLSNANPSVVWTSLQIGQSLRVPGYGSWTTYTVVSGDTGNAIAAAEGISFSSLSAANPSVNWNNLQLGQVLSVPAAVSPTSSTLPSSASSPTSTAASTAKATTSSSIATTSAKSSTVGSSSSVTTSLTNPKSTAQSSISSTTPSASTFKTSSASTTSPFRKSTTASTSSSTSAVSSPSSSAVASSTTSSIIIASSSATTVSSITTTSPAPTSTIPSSQTATVTSPNAVSTLNNSDGASSGTDTYTFYQGNGSVSAGWPTQSQWLSFSVLWSNLSPYIGQSCSTSFNVANNSPSENTDLYNAIQSVASATYLDHRLILAIILQESSGCVRVPTTASSDGIINPGLMQDFNGSGSCNFKNGTILNPCPTSNINQMVMDGVMGTTSSSSTLSYGLVQDVNNNGGYSGSMALYRAARIYNSGSVPSSEDLGAAGATRCYCSDVANRLMGWINAKKTCTLDE